MTFALRCAFALAALAQALFLLAAVGWLQPVAIGVVVLLALWNVGRASARPGLRFLVFLPLLLLALHPPLAFDETLYHLPFVRALAQEGRLQFLTGARFPVFPQLHELLCVPAFLLGGATATHLVSLVEVMIAAALLWEWRGPLAAALLLGSPIVLHLATITYVDAALMLFVTAGFYALDRDELALSGFLFGTACSVKYLGGYFALAALAIVLVRRGNAMRFALCCAAAALPTTIWLFASTGDPLFPFLRASIWSLPPPHVAPATRVVRTLRVAWDVTFARERVNFQPPFTPLFIAMIVAARRSPFALVAAGYAIVFAFLPQDSRYLVPLLPLLSVAAAAEVTARWPKAVPWLAAIAITPGIAYLAYRLAINGLPPLTAQQRRAELARRVPEYEALMRADGMVYVCGAEQLKDYAPAGLLGDHAGPYSFDRILTGDVAANLRRIGARYFLVSKRVCGARQMQEMDLVYEDAGAQLWRVQSTPQRR